MPYRLLLASFFLALFCSPLIGQIDSHYWTHQYGAKGLLLNGAVIASAEGETAIFYNPGSIGIDDNLGFAFSFLSPSYSNLQTTNFIGDNNVINDNGFSFAPGFLGVRFKPFKNDKFVAAASAFKRFKTDISFRDRVVDKVNGGNLLIFRGDLDFERKISEDWYGLGLFYRAGKRLGIGITQFSVWHSQSLDFNLKKEIVAVTIPDQTLLSWRSELGYKLNVSSGFITKLGMCYRHEKFSLGLTLTSPIYGLLRKKASYFVEDHRVNAPIETHTTVSNRNTVVIESFKSAGSIGLGLDLNLGKSVVSISMEYFDKVDQYKLFDDVDDSIDGLALEPQNTEIRLISQNENVFNVAIGILRKSSEKITFLAGFRTDYDQNNSLTFNSSTEYLGTTGDIFHITGGGMVTFGKNQVSFGLDFGYGGKKDGKQIADLSNLTQANLFEITGKNNVTSRFYSAMLFLTYDFIFARIEN